MLSFSCVRIGELDLLLPVGGHIVFTTVAGQGWLAGQIALSGCIAGCTKGRIDNQAFSAHGVTTAIRRVVTSAGATITGRSGASSECVGSTLCGPQDRPYERAGCPRKPAFG
jgi:hypothetical protein